MSKIEIRILEELVKLNTNLNSIVRILDEAFGESRGRKNPPHGRRVL